MKFESYMKRESDTSEHPEDYRVGMSGINSGYSQPGLLGHQYADPEPYKSPPNVKYFAGFGATEQDLDLGYLKKETRELPDYDKANYNERYTEASKPDENFANTGVLPEDVEFRNKERVSKGFLTRPRIPTER